MSEIAVELNLSLQRITMHALKTFHRAPGKSQVLPCTTNQHRAGGITDWKDGATSFGLVGSPVTEAEATSFSLFLTLGSEKRRVITWQIFGHQVKSPKKLRPSSCVHICDAHFPQGFRVLAR